MGPRFGLVLGSNDEAVPEEDFGGYGHVEEDKVRFRNARSVEEVFEGADSSPVKVENFVQGGDGVCDYPKARSSSFGSRLL